MAFDAGSIIAHLDIDTSKADRKLKEFDDKAGRSSKVEHKVRLSAVFDNASMGRARQAFAQLDNMISRDAATRLRSSPQGSVLGSLNALFSPHPVTGAPSPAQAASQGLLGKVSQQQKSLPQAVGTSTTETTTTSQAQEIRQAARNGGLLGGILSRLGGGGGSGGGGGGQLAGGILGGIGPSILGIGAMTAGKIGLGGAALGALPSLIGGLSPLLAAAPGLLALKSLTTGALNNVTPLSQLASQIQNQQQAGLGATAAGQKQIASEQAQLAAGLAQLPAAQKSAFNSLQFLNNAWQNLTQSFAPVVAKALSSVAGLFKALLPDITHFFAASAQLMGPLIGGIGDIAKTLLPLLTAGIKAAVPVLRPLLDGIGKLVGGLLPGLITLVKASSPAVAALAQIFSTLGKDLGKMFAAFAPVIRPSAVLLKALLGIVSALFPIIGELAGVFAKSLAPVFTAFAGAIKSLLPFLTLAGKVLAALASAILGDLVSAFTALATLLKDIAPALNIVARTLMSVFKVLENSGVFAVLGNVLEKLAPVLAKLINLIVSQLAPILPVIITLISQFASILVTLAAAGLTTVLQGITWLLQKLPFMVPLLGALGAAWLAVNLIMDANPIGLIILAITALIGVVTLLVTHWHQVWTDIKHWAMDAWNFIWNGFGKYLLPLLGPAGLIILGIIEVVKHWKIIWGTIKQIAKDFWTWIWTDFGQKIWNFLTKTLPGWFMSLPTTIENLFTGALSWLKQGGINIITGLWDGLKQIWNDVLGWFGHLAKDVLHALGINSPPAWAIQAGKDIMQGLGIGISHGKAHIASLMKGIGNVAAAAAGGVGGTIQNMMKAMAAARGWTGSQWTSLFNVEMREAGFNLHAKNPSSGAYGLAQFINGPSEYYAYGGNPNTAAGQITGMLNYIAQRYGNPGAAWQHELNFGWYDQGGWLQTGLSMNMTGGREAVLTPAQSSAFLEVAEALRASRGHGSEMDDVCARLDTLIAIMAGAPRRTAAGIGQAVSGAARGAAIQAMYGAR